jgi:hypothetical protein
MRPANGPPLRAAVALLLAAAGCSRQPNLGTADLAVRVELGAAAVRFGDPVPLTVVRTWRRGLVPQEWSEQAFAPLRLRLVAASRRSSGTHVEDRRRYDAFAFGAGTLHLALPPFVARDADGSDRTVPGPEVRLEVRSVLPSPESPLEMPSGPLLPPRPAGAAWWAAAAAGAAAAAALWWRRSRPVPARTPARALDAPAVALARLRLLRAQVPADEPAVQDHFTALAAVLRDYVAARFGVPGNERTTQEILAADGVARLGGEVAAQAAQALGTCDLVKFARMRPAAAQREGALDAAEAFVRGSAPEAAA